MKYFAHFFIANSYKGMGEIKLHYFKGGSRPTPSLLFFCEFCGDTFARVVVKDEEGEVQEWEAWRKCCSKCKQKSVFYSPPGAIYCSWLPEVLEAMPKEVLERELLLTIKALEEAE